MGIRNWFRRKTPATSQKKPAAAGKKKPVPKPVEERASTPSTVVKPPAAKPEPFSFSNEALWQLGGQNSSSFAAECKRLKRTPAIEFGQLLREIETNPKFKKSRAGATAIHRKIWMEDPAYLTFRAKLESAIRSGAFKDKKEQLKKYQEDLEAMEKQKTLQEGRELARLFAGILSAQK